MRCLAGKPEKPEAKPTKADKSDSNGCDSIDRLGQLDRQARNLRPPPPPAWDPPLPPCPAYWRSFRELFFSAAICRHQYVPSELSHPNPSPKQTPDADITHRSASIYSLAWHVRHLTGFCTANTAAATAEQPSAQWNKVIENGLEFKTCRDWDTSNKRKSRVGEVASELREKQV